MTDSHARIEQLNALAPGFMKLLGGSIIELDMDSQRAIFTFTVPLDYTATPEMWCRVDS